MLYAAELTWNGRKGMEGEYQAAINRMGRTILGFLQSTPLGIVAAENALTPAKALLDYRHARFTQRFLARPEGGGGPDEILGRKARLTESLLRETGLKKKKKGIGGEAGIGKVEDLPGRGTRREREGRPGNSKELER